MKSDTIYNHFLKYDFCSISSFFYLESANFSPVAKHRQTHPKYGRSQSAARDMPSKSINDMSKYCDMTLPASFGRQRSRSQVHGKIFKCSILERPLFYFF